MCVHDTCALVCVCVCVLERKCIFLVERNVFKFCHNESLLYRLDCVFFFLQQITRIRHWLSLSASLTHWLSNMICVKVKISHRFKKKKKKAKQTDKKTHTASGKSEKANQMYVWIFRFDCFLVLILHLYGPTLKYHAWIICQNWQSKWRSYE